MFVIIDTAQCRPYKASTRDPVLNQALEAGMASVLKAVQDGRAQKYPNLLEAIFSGDLIDVLQENNSPLLEALHAASALSKQDWHDAKDDPLWGIQIISNPARGELPFRPWTADELVKHHAGHAQNSMNGKQTPEDAEKVRALLLPIVEAMAA